MKKLALTFVALAAAVSLTACGSDSGEQDVFQLPADGGVDVVTRGEVANLDECEEDNDCADAEAECMPIGTGGLKECLRKCDTTNDCGFSTFCVPANGGTGGDLYGVIAGHCFVSFCGEGRSNGSTGKACTLGGEVGVTNAPEGWCQPYTDGVVGLCWESGTVAAGGTCDYATLFNRDRADRNCDPNSFCLPQTAGATTGICESFCDPLKILEGDPNGTNTDDAENPRGCTGDRDCYDNSFITTTDNTMVPKVFNTSTIGICDTVVACDMFATNTCATVSGQKHGCTPTNPLHATGICGPSSDGNVAAGGTCSNAATSADANQCMAGNICFGTTATNLKCEELCDPAAETTTCADGQTCTTLRWNSGTDTTANTRDDNYTVGWAACL
jgi:hypothetical protein